MLNLGVVGGVFASSIWLVVFAVPQRVRQTMLAAALALAAFFVMRGARTPEFSDSPAFAVSLFVVGLPTGWLLWGALSLIGKPSIAQRLRRRLSPSQWGPTPSPADDRALAARWFVTVAAATGSMVGQLAAARDFWEPLAGALAPGRVMITVLVTFVSITLIGPFEEFVFGGGAHPPEGAERLRSAILQSSPRAWGRLALVFLLMLQISLLHKCVEERLNGASGAEAMAALVGAALPAVITYYWCAALQHAAPSIGRASGRMALAMAAVMSAGFALFGVVLTAASGQVTAFLGTMMILAFAGFAVWVMARAGAWPLDFVRGRRWSPLVAIGLVVLAEAAVSVPLTAVSMLSAPANAPGIPDQLLTAALSSLGWGLGLLVSGFPSVLRVGVQAHHEAGSVEAAAAG